MRILSQDGSIDVLYGATSVIEVLPIAERGKEEPEAWAVSAVISDLPRNLGMFRNRKNAVSVIAGIVGGASGMTEFVKIPEDPDAEESAEAEVEETGTPDRPFEVVEGKEI